MDNERDRDPFLTAPAPNTTNHIFLENKLLNLSIVLALVRCRVSDRLFKKSGTYRD